MTAVLILYDWTTSAILAEPIENAQDETIVIECSKRKLNIWKMRIQTCLQYYRQCREQGRENVPGRGRRRHTIGRAT